MPVSDKVENDDQDIADLSDLNKPTKIGERFSELFDNEWTDAFEEIYLRNYESRIRFLLLIMEVSIFIILVYYGDNYNIFLFISSSFV